MAGGRYNGSLEEEHAGSLSSASMADSAYDLQLREQEREFEEKLRELRRRSAATPGSTPLVPRGGGRGPMHDPEDGACFVTVALR